MSDIAFVEALRLSAERQKLLLTLLGCVGNGNMCTMGFGSNVAKVLLSIRLVQNKAKGTKCDFSTTSKIL